jgi:hypothetical protein
MGMGAQTTNLASGLVSGFVRLLSAYLDRCLYRYSTRLEDPFRHVHLDIDAKIK